MEFEKLTTGDSNLDRVQDKIAELARKIPDAPTPIAVTVTSDYKVKGNEDVIHPNAQTGAIRITLLSPRAGLKPLTIQQTNPQSGSTKVNPVTIVTPDGSKTIGGKASITLDSSGTGSVRLTCDGKQYWPTFGGSSSTSTTTNNTTIINGDGTDVTASIPIIVVPTAPKTKRAQLLYDNNTLIVDPTSANLKFRQSTPTVLVGNPTGSTADVIDIPPVGGSPNSGNVTANFTAPGLPALGLMLDFNADSIAGADGSAIPNWVDSTGNHTIANVVAGTPVLKTGSNGIAGHNVVRFTSGTAALQCYLSLPLQVRDWVGMTVYYVARSGSTSPYSRYGGVFGWQATGQFLNIALGSATDGQGAGWTNVGDKGFGNVDGWTTATPFWGSYRYDKHNWTIEGVRSPTGTVADTSWPTDSHTVAWIGSNYYLGSQSDNDVSRLLVYNRRLTDEEDAAVLQYLTYEYGFTATEPSSVLRVAYPDTLTNNFAVRYAHPAGSDTDPRHDGKTWQTAKATWLGAWDSVVAELGTGALIELHLHDGIYVGGEVASQGFWLGAGTEGAGWRQWQPHRIIGHGGQGPGRGFSFGKARIYQGRPGDSQAFDKSKPLIWMPQGSGYGEVYNIMPVQYGFARLGVKPTGTRDGNLEACRWENVQMISPPDTDPVFGPCFDCGWINQFTFDDCQAAGSAIYHDVTLAGGDHSTAAGSTITLANGAFDSTYVGGYLVITGGPIQGQWFISAVNSATNVTVYQNNGVVLADCTFTTETIQKAQGPQILDDDDHAGFLFRPTAPDMSGQPGSMGTVYVNNLSTQQCGVVYYPGVDGEIGLFMGGTFITEGGPQPHPVQIKLCPGATLPPLSGSDTQVDIATVTVADGDVFDNYNVWIDPVLQPQFGVGTIACGPFLGGAVYGPCIWRGNGASEQASQTTPQTQDQYGWFAGGKLTGNHDAGRRIAAPGTALPSSSGSVGNLVTNLLSDNPAAMDASAWTGADGAVVTSGNVDYVGLTNAGKVAAGNSGYMNIPQSTAAPASTVLVTGDFIIVGLWVRATTGKNKALARMQLTGGADITLTLQPVWAGNKEWEFWSGYSSVTTGGTAALSLALVASPDSDIVACYPVAAVLKLSDGYTKEAAAEMAAHLATWNPNLAQGSAGTFRNQPFVASGGIGVDPSVPVTPSGTASPTKNLPLLSADGMTVQGYIPVIPTNSNLPSALSVPAATEIVYSTGSNLAGDTVLTFDSTTKTVAAGNVVTINGATAPTNAALVVGTANNANRDRVQLFVGGGALPDSPDNTLFQVSPEPTTIPAGRTTGVWATQRIGNLTYTGTSSPTITEATSLYIDGQPTLSGLSGLNYAIHVASGDCYFQGSIRSDVGSATFITSGIGWYWQNSDGGACQGISALNASTGFFYIPTTSPAGGGTPTGTPGMLGSRAGATPMVYDPTGDKLYIWNTVSNTWKAH